MSIAEKVRNVVENVLPEWSFIYDDWQGVDRLISKAALPAVFCILPNGGRLSYRNGRIRHVQDIALAIAWKVQKDADGEDNDTYIEESVHIAGRLIQALERSGYFSPLGQVSYTTFYEQMSSVVTGVVLQLTLEEEAECQYFPTGGK